MAPFTHYLEIVGCLIEGNETDILANPPFSGHVRNNTIVHNTRVGIHLGGSGGDVSNNILFGNGTGISSKTERTRPPTTTSSATPRTLTGTPPDYFGQAITTNANGDPALQDPDGTTVDIGACYFDQAPTGVPVPDLRRCRIACSLNPFNPVTVISYTIPRAGHVDLSVFDTGGHLVTTLVDAAMAAGTGTVAWRGFDCDDRRVPSGTYLLRLRTPGGVASGKVLLAK